jgi:hypothetical protein
MTSYLLRFVLLNWWPHTCSGSFCITDALRIAQVRFAKLMPSDLLRFVLLNWCPQICSDSFCGTDALRPAQILFVELMPFDRRSVFLTSGQTRFIELLLFGLSRFVLLILLYRFVFLCVFVKPIWNAYLSNYTSLVNRNQPISMQMCAFTMIVNKNSAKVLNRVYEWVYEWFFNIF